LVAAAIAEVAEGAAAGPAGADGDALASDAATVAAIAGGAPDAFAVVDMTGIVVVVDVVFAGADAAAIAAPSTAAVHIGKIRAGGRHAEN
jgi:hypothetical protein